MVNPKGVLVAKKRSPFGAVGNNTGNRASDVDNNQHRGLNPLLRGMHVWQAQLISSGRRKCHEVYSTKVRCIGKLEVPDRLC